jgi:type I restriction enzyme S subunit
LRLTTANWPVHALSDLCDIQIGRTPARAQKRFWGDGFPWLSIADMEQGEALVSTKEHITQAAFDECGSRLLDVGTLVLSFKLSIGKLGFVKTPMATNEAIAALIIRDSQLLDGRYLYRFLRSCDVLGQTDRAVMGATLNKAKLQRIPVAVPSMREQRYIAEVLDRADEVRRKRTAATAEASAFLRATFLDLFGDPIANSKGWPEKAIADLATVTTGNTPPRAEPAYFGNFVEWIKSDNLNTHHHHLTKAAEGLSEAGLRVGRSVPAGSTLITCIAGSPSCIGNAALSDRRVAFNQQINALTPKDGIEPEYLYAATLFSKPRIQAASTSGMKGMVSKGALEKIQYILPPKDAREKFVGIFREVKALTEKLERAALDSEALYGSLAQEAFQRVTLKASNDY